MTGLAVRQQLTIPEAVVGRHARPAGPAPIFAAHGALVGLLALGCGVVAATPAPPALRAVLLGIFVLTGPGIAVVMHLPLPTAAAVAAVPTIGLATIAGTTTVLIWFHRWPQHQLLWILLALVAVALLRSPEDLAALRALRAIDLDRLRSKLTLPWRKLTDNPQLILLACALLGWLTILPALRDVPYSQFGLLFVRTGPAILACTLVAVVAFFWALRQNRLRTAALAIGVVVVVQRLTVTLITAVPIYGWTYKHLGVIDYIHRFGSVPPGNDIYGQWPSFFTTFAWFTGVTGVTPIAVAHVFAPLVHVLLALLIAAIARLVGLDQRTALTAAMLAELVNWVGQDYFSPQAGGIVIALGIVALLVASRTAPAAGYLSIPLFAALVPLHQLTPYWLCGIAITLALTRRLRPWWLPIPYAGLLAGYLVPRLPIVAPYGIFSGFNPVANAHSNADFAGTFGKTFTSVICRSLSAGIVVLAVVCAVLWWRQHKPCLVPAVLAFSSFAVLTSQNYGGEAIFRVYLFAVPGCAVLIAPLVVQAISLRPGSRIGRANVLACWAGALFLVTFAGLQGYYGLWSLVIEYPSQVTWGDELMAQERAPVKIITLYPAGFSTRSSADYARFDLLDPNFDQTLPGLPGALDNNFASAGQLTELTTQAGAFQGNTYIVFDRQANLGLEYYGLLGPGMTRHFEDLVGRNPAWHLYRSGDVTTIYKFIRAATP
jgi:hypothetical protein